MPVVRQEVDLCAVDEEAQEERQEEEVDSAETVAVADSAEEGAHQEAEDSEHEAVEEDLAEARREEEEDSVVHAVVSAVVEGVDQSQCRTVLRRLGNGTGVVGILVSKAGWTIPSVYEKAYVVFMLESVPCVQPGHYSLLCFTMGTYILLLIQPSSSTTPIVPHNDLSILKPHLLFRPHYKLWIPTSSRHPSSSVFDALSPPS